MQSFVTVNFCQSFCRHLKLLIHTVVMTIINIIGFLRRMFWKCPTLPTPAQTQVTLILPLATNASLCGVKEAFFTLSLGTISWLRVCERQSV